MRNWTVRRYMTERPKTMRQRMGWGRMKGPLGKASTDMMRKKTSTLWISFSSQPTRKIFLCASMCSTYCDQF